MVASYMDKIVFEKWLNILVFSLLCLTPYVGSSQIYVSSSSELVFVSAIDLSTSSSWETDKNATPGYFTWLADSEDYLNATDAFHINGYVKKIGNSAFIFPVGSGTDLRTLTISAPVNSLSEYGVAWLPGDPSVISDPTNGNALHSTTALSGSLTAVSSVGQWDWVPVVDDGAGLSISVSIPVLSGNMFANPANLRLVGWNGTAWVSLGTSGASGLTEDSVLSGTMIAGIQSIGIGSISSYIEPPIFDVVQNSNGLLSVSGTAEKNSSVLITFPDGTTIIAEVDNTGYFGPVLSLTPQVNKGVVTAIASTSSGSSSSLVTVSYDYPITVLVSEAFSPNGDGINDTWVIYELDKYPNSTVRVYNRWGIEVFSDKNYQNDWDGHFKDNKNTLPQSGSYYYQIDFSSNGTIDKQGWLYIKK